MLHVIDTLGMGGAETWLMELLRFWRRGSAEAPRLDVVATSGRRGIFDDEARALGASIFYLRYGRSTLVPFARALRRVLASGGYDAMHDHQDYSSGWHFLLAAPALPRVRVVHVHNPAYQIRNNYGVTVGRRVTARIGKWLISRLATHIAGTSRQVLSEYGFDAPLFSRIPKQALHCGFDPARFREDPQSCKASLCEELGWPSDAKIVLCAGRIDRSAELGDPQNHKNSAFSVAVGLEALRRDGRIRLLFAGASSPAVAVLEQRIAAQGFGTAARFAGVRRDIARLMAASDVLLFPSRGEGLGMVAVEAQAAGLPVLASTAVPRECVVVPELVRFRDLRADTSQWAADVLELAKRPRDAAEANRRVAASRFAIAHSADALHRLYSDVAPVG